MNVFHHVLLNNAIRAVVVVEDLMKIGCYFFFEG